MLCNRKIFYIIQYKSVFKNTEVKQKGLEKENMAEDILLALTAAENGVRVENKVSGDTAVSSEVIVVNGRIAKSTSGIVGRTKNGVFYTPVLVHNAKDSRELLGTANGVFFKSDGKTRVSLQSYAAVEDKKLINLPTLISNAKGEIPTFYNMIAYGENALKLSDAPVGSSAYIVGELRDCWVGKFSIKVLWVIEMNLVKRKVGYNESRLQ